MVEHHRPATHEHVSHGAAIGRPHQLLGQVGPRLPVGRHRVVDDQIGQLPDLDRAPVVPAADRAGPLDGGHLEGLVGTESGMVAGRVLGQARSEGGGPQDVDLVARCRGVATESYPHPSPDHLRMAPLAGHAAS